jgi:signal transduction histidine kinase/DNA-binding NarL/FixJ family response regulator
MAILAVALATAARWLLIQYFRDSYPFALIFLAVIFSAWYGGFGPAMLASVLGLCTTWFLPDRRPSVGNPFIGLAVYFAFSFGIAALGSVMVRARERIARQIEELTSQQAELRLINQLKDQFLAVLAHELRNPLAPIANALDILKQPGIGAPTAAEARDVADRQLKHLTRLVDDLLDVSRIMRGKIELRKENVELAAIVARAVETARPLIDGARHQLTVSLPDEPVWLEADLVRLAQAIGNLLCNAAKYTEPGGAISLTATCDTGEVAIRVCDSGIGIAPEVMPRLFEMFMQVAPGASRSQGGLGIGLTLVKNLISMHGGTVEARSDGLGKGSEFLIRLPTALAPLQSEEPLSTIDAGLPVGRKVLVVDDNADAAQSLAVLLRLRGHEVQVALGGAEALQMVNVNLPELVFLDIGMPDIDGYEVARRLRSQFNSELTLVALTGWGTEQDRRRSREAGFDHHLTKPVDLAAVEAVIAAARNDQAAGAPNDQALMTNDQTISKSEIPLSAVSGLGLGH